MLLLIQLKFESIRLSRSTAFWTLVLLYLSLLTFGFSNGAEQAKDRRQSLQAVQEGQRKDLLEQKAQADSIARGLKTAGGWWKNPANPIVTGGMWRGGRQVGIETAPQNLLAIGVSDLQPNLWRIALLGKDARSDSQLANPVQLAAGHFDVAFVLALLLPLLIIGLTFNIISSEKEQGTLALHQVQPVSMRRLFFNKMLARFLFISLVSAVGIVLAGWLTGIPIFHAALWETAGLTILYAFFWFMVALGINLSGQSSAQNALLCIGAWLAFTIILPAGVNMAAQKIFPVPSKAGYQTDIRHLENQLEENREARLAEFYKNNPQLKQKPEAEKAWQDWYRESFGLHAGEQRLKDSIEQKYTEPAARQNQLSEQLAICSPTLSFYQQINEMAGVSLGAYKTLERQIDTLQHNWAKGFLQKFEQGANLTQEDFDYILNYPDKVVQNPQTATSYQGFLFLLLQCVITVFWVRRKRVQWSN